ncbi:MAG: VUT family protein [Lachnospiraceae bacterium]|nr:VUT family protein [Lachnospiraceae bacterium]
MPNELLLILNLFFTFGSVILFHRIFGKTGLYAWTIIATITANIEVLILVDAFGMEMTLGNILFASNFLVTDILSELYGKKEADKAVNLGIATSFFLILITQSWLLYTPSPGDWASESIHIIFQNTPRLILASFLVYAICQRFDVWLYHKLWELTTDKAGNSDRFLWIRNNGATLISQLFNAVFYTFGAFGGLYNLKTLIHICISSYVIFIVTSLADTPFIYLARTLYQSRKSRID